MRNAVRGEVAGEKAEDTKEVGVELVRILNDKRTIFFAGMQASIEAGESLDVELGAPCSRYQYF